MSGETERLHIEITGGRADLQRAARGAIRDIRDVAQETRKADAEIVASNALAERSLSRLEKRQAGLAQASRNFGASWRAIGWTALLANVGPVTAAVTDLGAAATGAGVALAPLAGTVATLPNLLGAAGQAGIVATLAFHGMGKALEGDQKALEALSPEAQRFVKTVRGELGPAVKDLQGIAQHGLLPGVTDGLHSLMKDMPVVKTLVADTSKELGSLARDAGKQFSTAGFRKDLKAFGEENVRVIHDLGDAGLHVADGVRHITMAAQPLVDDLARGVDHISASFDQWAQHARRDGSLADFFDLTDTRVHQSVDILGNLGSTLLNIAGAAQPLAGHLMGGLVDDTQKLADLTGSKTGKSSLAHFFSDAEQPLHEVGALVHDLAVDLGGLAASGQGPLAQLAHDARVDVLPAINDLAQLITVDLLPHAITLAGHLGHLAHDMEPGLKAIAPLATGVLDTFSGIVSDVDSLTRGLPGVAKLIPGLLVTAAVLRSWRLLGQVWETAPGSVRGAVQVARGQAPAAAAAGRGAPAVVAVPVVTPAAAGTRVPVTAALTQRERQLTARGGVILDPAAIAARTATTTAASGGGGGLAAGARALARSPAAAALGQSLALGAAAAFGPEFAKHLVQGASGKTPNFNLPKQPKIDVHAPVNLNPLKALGLPDLGPTGIAAKGIEGANKLLGALSGVDKKLSDFSGHADSTFKKLQQAGDSRGLTQLAHQAREMAKEFPDAGDQLRAFAGAVDTAARGKVVPQFEKMRAAGGHSMSFIRQSVSDTMFSIEQDLGAKSAAGKAALSHNFDAAMTSVKESMAAGKISTKTGLDYIEFLMRQKLAMFGITGKQANRYLSGKDTVSGKPLQTNPNDPSRGAAGGMLQIGRPGESAHDDVPALLNGAPAVVARGEVVGVFNRHQQAGLDAMARANGYGSLAHYMASQPKHYMAGGGLVGGQGRADTVGGGSSYVFPFPKGVSVGWRRVDQGQDFQSDPGAPLLAIAPGSVSVAPNDPGGFGPDYPLLHITSGSLRGRTIYYGHTDDVKIGSVDAGDVIARTSRTGHNAPPGWAEIGFWPPGSMSAGSAIAPILHALASHLGIAGLAGLAPGGGKGGGGVSVPELDRVKFAPGLGALSAIGQAGLDAARAAAQQRLADAVGASGGGGGGISNITSGPWVDALHRIASEKGWSAADWMWIVGQESGGQAVYNRQGSGAFGVGQLKPENYRRLGGAPGSSLTEQVVAMGRYIAERYGNPTKARAFWEAHHTYAGGGLISAAGGLLSGSSIGDALLGTANPVKPDKSSSSKKKHKRRAGKPFTGGPAMPDVSKVKGRIHKHRKAKLPKWLKAFQGTIPEDLVGLVPDLDKLFEQPISNVMQALTNLTGRNDLTDEQATVTLYDSEQFADLTNYLAAHPDVLKGLSPSAWMDKYGDSLEVVNQDGMTVQGRFVRGIAQGVAELDALLALHGNKDRPGTLRGLLGGELSAAIGGQGKLTKEGFRVGSELAQLQATWEADQRLLAHNRGRLAKLNLGPGSWQQRVADNDEKIDVLEDYLRKLRSAGIGHRLTEDAQRNRQKAQDKIAALRKENTTLKRDKPAPRRGSKKATAHVRAEVAALHAEDSDLIAMMNAIAGNTDSWNPTSDSPAGKRVARASAISESLKTFGDAIHRLTITDIPQEDLAIAQLLRDRGELTGTTVAPPAIQRGTQADNSQLADLLRQQLDDARKQHAIDTTNLQTFQGFAPLLQGRLVGSFAHGTVRVPETGLALVHKDETIVPDPQGPYGSQLAPAAGVAPAPVQVMVQIAGDMAGFIRVVDARIDGRSARVTSQDLGAKQRLLTVAPGR